MLNIVSNKKRVTAYIGIALACCCFVSPTVAEDSESFLVRYGVFLPAIDTSVRVDSQSLGPGNNVDLEDDLGLKKDLNMNRFELFYRFFERHRIQVARYDFSRNASRTIDQSLQIGDQVFNINTTVTSRLDTSLTELGYMYSFLKDHQAEASVTIGIHYMDSNFSASSPAGGGISVSPGFDAPLPLIGVEYKRSFGKKITAYASAQFFAIDYEGLSGSLKDYRLAGEYFFTRRFGIGAGYHLFDMDLGLDETSYDGKFQWQYEGLQVYGVFRF